MAAMLYTPADKKQDFFLTFLPKTWTDWIGSLGAEVAGWNIKQIK